MTTVYGLYRTGKEAPKVEVFASAEIARNSGNGFSIVKEQDCLADTRLFPTGFLVDIYNINAERKISKFRDRATAESRVWKMLTDQEAPQVDEETKTAETEDVEKPKTRKSSAKFKGRRIVAKVDSNPRTKKTGYGYRAMEVVLGAGEGGILYEDYLDAGGRRVDLDYDLDKGCVGLV